MPYDFDTTEWTKLVEKVLTATETGQLVWEIDPNFDPSTNARHFRAYKGQTSFTFFGRFRGFSYQMSVRREIGGQPASEKPIKVTNKQSAQGIPFDLLFRAIREQVRSNEAQAHLRAAAASLVKILGSIDHGTPLTEEEQLSLVCVATDDDWDTVIDRLINATRTGAMTWVASDPPEGQTYTSERGSLRFVIEKDPIPEHGFVLWIDLEEGDFCFTRQWEDSPLETLAELVGIHTRNTEAQFAAMAKAALLEDILSDIDLDDQSESEASARTPDCL